MTAPKDEETIRMRIQQLLEQLEVCSWIGEDGLQWRLKELRWVLGERAPAEHAIIRPKAKRGTTK